MHLRHLILTGIVLLSFGCRGEPAGNTGAQEPPSEQEAPAAEVQEPTERAGGTWTLTVEVSTPGFSISDAEHLVAIPLEAALASIATASTLRTYVDEGHVVVRFDVATDDSTALNVVQEVRGQLAGLQSTLPADLLESPVVTLIPHDAKRIFYALSPRIPDARLPAESEVRDAIEGAFGTLDVAQCGAGLRIIVELDQARQRAYGLTVAQVAAALSQVNIPTPVLSHTVRGNPGTLEELNAITVAQGIALRDIARIHVAPSAAACRCHHDNGEAICGVATVHADLQDAETALLARLREAAPQGDVDVTVGQLEQAFRMEGLMQPQDRDPQSLLGPRPVVTGGFLVLGGAGDIESMAGGAISATGLTISASDRPSVVLGGPLERLINTGPVTARRPAVLIRSTGDTDSAKEALAQALSGKGWTVSSVAEPATPRLSLQFDREKLAQHQLQTTDVVDVIRAHTVGLPAGRVVTEHGGLDVYVQLGPTIDLEVADDLWRLTKDNTISGPLGAIPLSEVIRAEASRGPDAVIRHDGLPVTVLQIMTGDGVDLDTVKAVIGSVALPDDVEVSVQWTRTGW